MAFFGVLSQVPARLLQLSATCRPSKLITKDALCTVHTVCRPIVMVVSGWGGVVEAWGLRGEELKS